MEPMAFVTTTPPGLSLDCGQREKLASHQVEGDRVGEEGVDDDRVPAPLVAGEEAAPVPHADLQARIVARHREVAVGDVDDDGSISTACELHVGEVLQHPLLRRARPEADEEDVPRLRVVGDGEVEEVGVEEARAVRVVDVHRALERVVEPEIARVRVLDDREPVVLRVLRVDDADVRLGDCRARIARVEDRLRAAQPVERRPVLRRSFRERPSGLRRERRGRDPGTDGRRRSQHGRNPHPLRRRATRATAARSAAASKPSS